MVAPARAPVAHPARGPRHRRHRARTHRRRHVELTAPFHPSTERFDMPTPLPIVDRAVRVAVVGLGQIAELVLPSYLERDDVVIVGLCDRDEEQLARWHSRCPDATATTSLDELLTVDADVVDVLVPTPAHAEVVEQVFR